MPQGRHYVRIDLTAIQRQIEMKVGLPKAKKYFEHLQRFMNYQIGPYELGKLASAMLGSENIHLHNHLLRSMLKNATLSLCPPPKRNKVETSLSVRVPNGCQRSSSSSSSLQLLCKDFPQSPRRGRTPNLRDRKLRDRPSPLGPHGKTNGVEDVASKFQKQSATVLLSVGSKPPSSEDDGDEVEQEAGGLSVYSRSPIRAPLGIPVNNGTTRKRKLFDGFASSDLYDSCHVCGELPDTSSLKKKLERKLEMEGLNVSVDCANLLNNSVDVYLRRLIKPCLELARSRSVHNHTDVIRGGNIPGLDGTWPVRNTQKPSRPVSASMLDFRVAMELNPSLLGENWPIQLEKICLHASE